MSNTIVFIPMSGPLALTEVKYNTLANLEKQFFNGEPCDISSFSDKNTELTKISLMDYMPEDPFEDETANMQALLFFNKIGAYDNQRYVTVPSGPVAVVGEFILEDDEDSNKIFFKGIPQKYVKEINKLF